jgi:lipopolysaccharide transport system ATP-binding protein
MTTAALWARGLGKRYRIGAAVQNDTLRDTIAARFRRGSRSPRAPQGSDLWAVRDVSFEVRPGEVLGIVGRNGAGKSTLLKVLSRITEPTEGHAGMRGRIASLLEVGTGFHPELTGRENIYVNGSLLGMKRAEISRRFDEIVAFAEVERFVDTPVKRYSSGMQVRLAFAVAAHLEPDILLIDEVLAVGDAGFQKKCLGKMKEVGHAGRTILFVSHNLAAVASLCQRAVLIDGGRIVEEGPASGIVRAHLASFGGNGARPIAVRTDRYGDGRLRVTHMSLADDEGCPTAALRSGENGSIRLHYRCAPGTRLRDVLVNLYLFTPWGERLCDLQTDFVGDNFAEIPAEGLFECHLPRVPLQPGSYPFTFRVYSSDRLMMDEVQQAGEIVVDEGDFHGSGRLPERGALFVDHRWACRSVEPELSAS